MNNLIYNLRMVGILAVLSVIFSLSCNKSESPEPAEQTDTEQGSSETVVGEPNDSVAVTVNGVDIFESQVDALLDTLLAQVPDNIAQMDSVMEQYRKRYKTMAIERLIQLQLLEEQVKNKNIEVTDEQVEEKINEIVSELDPPPSMEEFEQMLAQQGMTFEQYEENVSIGMKLESLLESEMSEPINIPEEDVKAFYDENRAQFESPEMIRASHILVQTSSEEPEADPNEIKEQARTKAEELLEQLRDGADFAELAKSVGGYPSAPNGGDLGFFPRGRMVPEFEEAAFALDVNQISDIVETEFGYHIIKLTDHQDARVIPFEEVKEQILERLTMDKTNEFATKYIESLKAKATIVYPESVETEEDSDSAVGG